MYRKIIALTLVGLFALTIGISLHKPNTISAVSAGDWRAGRIIDDFLFTDKNAMSIDQIQAFLNSKVGTGGNDSIPGQCDTSGSRNAQPYSSSTRAQYAASRGLPTKFTCLSNYYEVPKINPGPGIPASNYGGAPIPAGAKSAAQLIWEAGQRYNISPKVLLVTIQKESAGPLTLDDWPFQKQFTYAMGAHCPDSGPGGSANCDENYAGFSIQIAESAALKRYYLDNMDQSWWPYKKLGNNSILYQNAKPECGSSVVNITTKATAALYTYTPYQPNQAALNNMYGTGDACSAYGNRNFWRIYNDWFGPTITEADTFTIAISNNGSPSQYLLFGGIKQAIPDPETKIAWGIENYPVVTLPASYLDNLPNGPYLDRLTRLNTSDSTVFFMDGGKRYRVMSQAMFDTWNFGSRPITNVPPSLFYIPADAGKLSYSIKNPTNPTTYMIDGTVAGGQTAIKPHLNDTIRRAWDGESSPVIPISSSYFNQIDNAIGNTITSTKMAFRGSEYQVMSENKLPQPGHIAPLYPGSAQTYSDLTFWRLAPGPTIAHLLRPINGPEVYLIDNGVKHHILSPDVLKAWTVNNSPIIGVNTGYLETIPTSTPINAYLSDSAGQLYLIDQAKMPIPSNLDIAYRNSGSVYAASSSLLSIFQTTPNSAIGIIKSRSSPSAYFLDNSGKKRHLEWTDKVKAYAGNQSTVMQFSDYIVNSISTAASPSLYVTDGTTNYVMDNGQKWTVSSSIASAWGLVNPQPYTDATLSRFPTGGALGSEIRDNQGGYFLIRGGNAYGTADINIADAWAIKQAPQHSTGMITGLTRVFMLTRFVRSNAIGDNRIFIINDGQWYSLSAQQRANLGPANEPIMQLNPTNAPNAISDWVSVVVKSKTGTPYVIDGGGKRFFMHQMVYDQWTNYGSLAIPIVADGFLNLLPTRGYIERAVKGTGPTVYSAEAGTKRHIQYPNTYNLFYAPFIGVTDQLLEAMPTGNPI